MRADEALRIFGGDNEASAVYPLSSTPRPSRGGWCGLLWVLSWYWLSAACVAGVCLVRSAGGCCSDHGFDGGGGAVTCRHKAMTDGGEDGDATADAGTEAYHPRHCSALTSAATQYITSFPRRSHLALASCITV
ncbi:hypothetical protein EJ06DRAFT_132239 [Trichodelitschia bisporula]|uniref:Uncharacterized protein n=1 Tax=Trichodelitschia bisporula TaxID=703511 RepID=A0A6G1HP95_9PEZI|nr:hypothetical protein EJ06DRAFT_132239 [Trichodelitschia bisporula]